MWIGLRNKNGFYWTDQSEVDFVNWGAGQPDGGSVSLLNCNWRPRSLSELYPIIFNMEFTY